MFSKAYSEEKFIGSYSSSFHYNEVSMGDENSIIGSTQSGEKASSHTTVAIVVPLCLLLIGVAAAYFYIKKRNSGSMNVSMRFHNPGYGLHKDEPDHKSILKPGQHEYTNPIDFSEDDTKSQTSLLHVNA